MSGWPRDVERRRPTNRNRVWHDKSIVFPAVMAALFVLAGGFYILRVVEDARQAAHQSVTETIVNRENGYKSAARSCRIEVLLGVDPDTTCLDPHVLAYFDPTEQRPTPPFACSIYRAFNIATPADCEGR